VRRGRSPLQDSVTDNRQSPLKTVLFRVDGGSAKDVGTGHIFRSLLLAAQLKGRASLIFASLDCVEFRYGHNQIASKGYPLSLLQPDRYHGALRALIDHTSPDLIVCDLYQYQLEELELLSTTDAPLMTFDQFDPLRRYSNYPINAVSNSGQGLYDGLDYIVIPPPQVIRRRREIPENIFVCFGGFDYLNLTLKVTQTLAKICCTQRIQIVVGNDYAPIKDLVAFTNQTQLQITLHQQPNNFEELMGDSDIALVSGGLTLFQSLSLGVPTIVISQYDHQTQTANDFEHYDAYVNLGQGEALDEDRVLTAVTSLVEDSEARRRLSGNAIQLVDGKGLDRVVRIIEKELAE
jgi:spore coat polysaccharide biosynthesis predicted glycosyltransferase SpsG